MKPRTYHVFAASRLPSLAPFVLLVVFVAPFVQSVGTLSGQEPVTSGRVATLREMTPPSQDRVLLGRIQLLGETMEEALASIENNQLQQFARKWAHASDLYGQLGDQISQASEAMGRAEVALERAEQTLALAAATTNDRVAPEDRERVVRDVTALRAQLLAQLTALRASYRQANADEQQAMLPRLDAMAQQLRQLDRTQEALRAAESRGVYASASAQVQGQIEQARQMLEYERRMLQVAAQSIRVAMHGSQAQIRQAIQIVEVQSQIPRGELQQLGQARKSVQGALEQVMQARRQAEQLVDRLIKTVDSSEIDSTALLQEIDALIQSGDAPTRQPNQDK